MSYITNGFKLQKPFGLGSETFIWSELKSVQFTPDYKSLIVIDLKNKRTILPYEQFNWYELIQNIPTRFRMFDHRYVEDFFETIQCCKVCRIKAVHNNNCRVCDSEKWNPSMSSNELNYYRQLQLDFYSFRKDNGIEIKITPEPEHGFDACKDWKLLISPN